MQCTRQSFSSQYQSLVQSLVCPWGVGIGLCGVGGAPSALTATPTTRPNRPTRPTHLQRLGHRKTGKETACRRIRLPVPEHFRVRQEPVSAQATWDGTRPATGASWRPSATERLAEGPPWATSRATGTQTAPAAADAETQLGDGQARGGRDWLARPRCLAIDGRGGWAGWRGLIGGAVGCACGCLRPDAGEGRRLGKSGRERREGPLLVPGGGGGSSSPGTQLEKASGNGARQAHARVTRRGFLPPRGVVCDRRQCASPCKTGQQAASSSGHPCPWRRVVPAAGEQGGGREMLSAMTRAASPTSLGREQAGMAMDGAGGCLIP